MAAGNIHKSPRSAVVRAVADCYDRCIVQKHPRPAIDVDLARRQHADYCNELRAAGFDILPIPADEKQPDCVFIEDTAVWIRDSFAGCANGEPSRRGEAGPVHARLEKLYPVHKVYHSMDGGDILRIGGEFFVGLSGRTVADAFVIFQRYAAREGMKAVPVNVRPTTLHLKSAVTHAGENLLIAARGEFDEEPFRGFEVLYVHDSERAFANVLRLPDRVVVSKSAPRLAAELAERNFNIRVLDISEFEKGDGGLTCLSILIHGT